mgnify:CR=1 FL=1
MELHLVCPQCQGVNRVLSEKKGDNPICGKCKSALLPKKPVNLSSKVFNKFVTMSGLPVVVDFWASWCGPCKMMAPAYEEAAQTLHPEVILAKVNTEENQELAGQYGIRSIPTLVLFKSGREKGRQSGAMNKNDLINWVRANI